MPAPRPSTPRPPLPIDPAPARSGGVPEEPGERAAVEGGEPGAGSDQTRPARARPGAAEASEGTAAGAAHPLVRLGYFVFGCLTFALAMIGVVVRGIPTTPFLLLTAFAFARSSPRLHRWLLTHRRFGPLLSDLQAGRGLTRRFKVSTIAFSWSLMLATAIWLAPAWPLRAFLALAAGAQLYVFVRVIPTRPPPG
jgi:uncharacterized protein